MTERDIRSESDAHGAPTGEVRDDELPPLSRRLLWVDSPAAVMRLVYGLATLCVLLAVADFVVHRHTYVPGEALPGYYAIVGFIAFTCIVLGARSLRLLIRRDESYYAPYGVDAETYPETGTARVAHGEPDIEPGAGEVGGSKP